MTCPRLRIVGSQHQPENSQWRSRSASTSNVALERTPTNAPRGTARAILRRREAPASRDSRRPPAIAPYSGQEAKTERTDEGRDRDYGPTRPGSKEACYKGAVGGEATQKARRNEQTYRVVSLVSLAEPRKGVTGDERSDGIDADKHPRHARPTMSVLWDCAQKGYTSQAAHKTACKDRLKPQNRVSERFGHRPRLTGRLRPLTYHNEHYRRNCETDRSANSKVRCHERALHRAVRPSRPLRRFAGHDGTTNPSVRIANLLFGAVGMALIQWRVVWGRSVTTSFRSEVVTAHDADEALQLGFELHPELLRPNFAFPVDPRHKVYDSE